MKKNLLLISLLASTASFAQVGINTETPKATLDVVGAPTDLAKVDGVIAPRISGNDLANKDALYTAAQTGAIVYVTAGVAVPTAKTINVTSIGYYYFDGAVWIKMASSTVTADNGLTKAGNNIQLGGTLLKNTDIATAGFNTTFSGIGKVGIGTSSPSNLLTINKNGNATGIVNSFVDGITITADVNSPGWSGPGLYLEGANATVGQKLFKLNYSRNTSGNSFLNFQAVADDAGSSTRPIMSVYHNGNVGIGGNPNLMPATEKLDVVDGNVRVREINSNAGSITDKIVVADTNGVLKTVNLSSGAVIGDIKSGFQTADHSGWIRLDGRLKSSLSASQQTAATSLGFGTSLPNATNSYLSQNATALGSISNANTRVINQNNLPNVTLGGSTNTVQPNIRYDIKNGSGANQAQIANGPSVTFLAADGTNGVGVYNDDVVNNSILSQNSHDHTITTNSINGGVTQQALNVQPQTMSVNMFVYLGQ